MPISSGANGWPIRHFKKTPAPEPKLKSFVNVMPRDPYYDPAPVRPARPPSPRPQPVVFYTPTSTRKIRPSPPPPLSPEPKRKRDYSPPPSPEPGCCGGSGSRAGCCGNGGGCGGGCCARICGNSVCCWTDDAYRSFGQRGTWLSRDGRIARGGCCGNTCCRRVLACLLGLLFFLVLLALILALIFGIQAYNREGTVTIIDGQNVYFTVLGKYQNCTDPNEASGTTSSLPLCNATTTILATTPSGFVTPFAELTTAGKGRISPMTGSVYLLLLVLSLFSVVI